MSITGPTEQEHGDLTPTLPQVLLQQELRYYSLLHGGADDGALPAAVTSGGGEIWTPTALARNKIAEWSLRRKSLCTTTGARLLRESFEERSSRVNVSCLILIIISLVHSLI
jgi:hypothetical protein